MKREKILIIGGGGHAKVIASIIKKLPEFELAGYTDPKDRGDLVGSHFLGSDESILHNNEQKIKFAVLGIGQIKSSAIRRNISDKYLRAGFKFPVIISPTACINEEVKIGAGTVIMDGVIINPSSQVGDFTIINTHSTIEHDCKIGDYVHIAPRVVLSGNVSIGNDALIGVGATVIQGVEIESEVILGAGSTATKKCESGSTYFGVPARKIK